MAVITVNGAEMPSPSKLEVEIFDVGSREGRSASGRLVRDRIAVKRRLTLKWACLTCAQMGTLLSAVAGGFFEAACPDPETGKMRASQYSCSERTAGVLCIRDGEPVWNNVKMEWTER